MGQIGIETAIAFQGMATHLGNGPVTFFEIVLAVAICTARNRIFQQGMIWNNRKTVVFFVDLPNKAGQERLDKFFWLGSFTILLGVNHRRHTIAVHHFLHLRRRDEVAFLRVDFQEAKAFFRGFYDPFCTRRLGMQLLFKLR
ncbi:hypothetical protein D3C80_1524910 [compost metagenome]